MTLLRRTPASSTQSKCAGCRQQGHVDSKTLHQQNPPVLNWRCRLTQVTCIMAVKRAVGWVGCIHEHTHTHGPFSGTTRVSRYQKCKPIWILLKQETVSGNGISWAICKSAPRSRQITTTAPHHSVFYRPDALLAT